MRTLHDKWLIDKSVAFGASVLAGADLAATDAGGTARLDRASHVIVTNVINETAGFLADSTLALLDKIPDNYKNPDRELLPGALPLSNVMSAVQSEIERRTTKAKRIPEILIAHAVYLLKHSHLSIRDFLKWLKRHKEAETRDIGVILKGLDSNEPSWAVIDRLLYLSRDATQQRRGIGSMPLIRTVRRCHSFCQPYGYDALVAAHLSGAAERTVLLATYGCRISRTGPPRDQPSGWVVPIPRRAIEGLFPNRQSGKRH